MQIDLRSSAWRASGAPITDQPSSEWLAASSDDVGCTRISPPENVDMLDAPRFSPNARFVAISYRYNRTREVASVRVRSAQDGRLLFEVQVLGDAWVGCAFTSDSAHLLMHTRDGGSVRVIRVTDHTSR